MNLLIGDYAGNRRGNEESLMGENPLVSIVIPVYKVEKYLVKSIHSVINQSYKNIDIILVDDGSPDQCPVICDNLASEFSNIKVIHKKNGGLSEARNFGIAQTSGEYILFLDSDDALYADAIEGLVQKAEESHADVIIPDRYTQVNESTNKKMEKFHFDKTGFIENPVDFAIEIIIGKGRAWRASSILYKASTIKNNHIEFPVGYTAEDIVFNLKLMSVAGKVGFYDRSTGAFLKRAGSITTSFQEDRDQVFLFIDRQIESFLIATNKNDKYGNGKRNELLCRNSITYISEIFSKRCDWQKNERVKKADEHLNNECVRTAFQINKINPYFNNGFAVAYYKIMFKLIKKNNKNLAYRFASLLGKLQ